MLNKGYCIVLIAVVGQSLKLLCYWSQASYADFL